MESNVQGLLGTSMAKIKEMVDANTVVGTPITMQDGVTLIPVSKISYGFASGGSDLPSKKEAELFGGGSGAGINITPIAFIVISGGDVRILSVVAKPDTSDKLVNLVPDLVDKVGDLFSKKKDKTTVKTETDENGTTVHVTETKTE